MVLLATSGLRRIQRLQRVEYFVGEIDTRYLACVSADHEADDLASGTSHGAIIKYILLSETERSPGAGSDRRQTTLECANVVGGLPQERSEFPETGIALLTRGVDFGFRR